MLTSVFSSRKARLIVSTLTCLAALSCGPANNNNANNSSLGLTGSLVAGAGTGLTSVGTKTCKSSDPNHLCIGLTLVSYIDSSGTPVLSESAANTLVDGMNQIWNQCNIGFQLEGYQAVDPSTKGLSYAPNWQTEGTQIRSTFQTTNTFLVVAVGPFSNSTIAVTEMPGGGPYGTIVDSIYATNPMTVGHELGHYMGLYHISDSTNLMNPYIGSNTSSLTASQCSTARSTDQADWVAMLR